MHELTKLAERAKALPSALPIVAGVGVALLVLGGVVAFALSSASSGSFEVVFAKLTPEDSAASADALRAAGIAFRVEAAGDAISVPTSKVHDARLLLAAQGLPRAGGVGFELFDKSDLGVSEFTQRVNLQRAIEGELSRTIGAMQKVRDARVHITMPKRGLLRTDDRGASAAVMLRLEAGRILDAKEVAGVRHLVAAAVPELSLDRVTIVDQNGSLLGAVAGDDVAVRGKLEQELESRVVAMLEPALGHGAVVARVTAEMDAADEDKNEAVYQPERSALRTERTRTETQNSGAGDANGVTGAAANNTEAPAATTGGAGSRGNSKNTSIDDRTRTYEVSGTTTRRVSREPRLVKLSVAVLVDAKGKPLAEAEMRKLTDLAKRAVGYDEERGDLLELSSASFLADAVAVDESSSAVAGPGSQTSVAVTAVAAGALAVLFFAAVAVAYRVTRRRRTTSMGVGTLEAAATMARLGKPGVVEDDVPVIAPGEAARNKARQLAAAHPERVALILEAWLGQAGVEAAGAAAKTTTKLKEEEVNADQ